MHAVAQAAGRTGEFSCDFKGTSWAAELKGDDAMPGIPDERVCRVARAVLSFLSQMQVIPVLIGGCALAAHGITQDILDIDLLVDCPGAELPEIANRAKRTGYVVDALSQIAIQDGVSAEVRLFVDGVQVDLVHAANPQEQRVYARASMMRWLDLRLRVACLADVVIEKLRAGRLTGLNEIGQIIQSKLGEYERHAALRACHDLGLLPRHAGLIAELFGD